MELLESQNPHKRKLIEASDRHHHEMKRELGKISEKSEKVLKNAIIIGGALMLAFVIVNQLSSSKTSKKVKKRNQEEYPDEDQSVDESPSMLSKIGDKAMTMASLFLLEIAKEKLSEYLQHRKSKNENP